MAPNIRANQKSHQKGTPKGTQKYIPKVHTKLADITDTPKEHQQAHRKGTPKWEHQKGTIKGFTRIPQRTNILNLGQQ